MRLTIGQNGYAGYAIRESDPFSEQPVMTLPPRETSPYVNWIKLLWQKMRGPVIEAFPHAPGLPRNKAAYMKSVEEAYVTDASMCGFILNTRTRAGRSRVPRRQNRCLRSTYPRSCSNSSPVMASSRGERLSILSNNTLRSSQQFTRPEIPFGSSTFGWIKDGLSALATALARDDAARDLRVLRGTQGKQGSLNPHLRKATSSDPIALRRWKPE